MRNVTILSRGFRSKIEPLTFVFSPAKRRESESSEQESNTTGFNTDCVSRISIHRDSMGQQHRVRIKRKRRLAYLRRKKASPRAAVARPAPAKHQAQKESVAAE